MKKSAVTLAEWLQNSAVRLGRVHFVLAGLYILSIVIYDAWQLITAEVLLQRWIMGSVLLVATALLWYAARFKAKPSAYYRLIIFGYVLLGVGFATFSVYTQRGMASRSVGLYLLPIIASAALLSRSALFAVATICAAAYSLAAVRYFVLNPSEGYKIELYGEVGFYCGVFFIAAALLWNAIRSKNADSS